MAFGNWRKYGGNPGNTPFDNSASRFGENRQSNGGIDQIKVTTPDFVLKRFGIFEKVHEINSGISKSKQCCVDEYIIFPTTMKAGETYTLSVGNAKPGCTYYWQMVSLDNVGTDGSAGSAGSSATSGSAGAVNRLYGSSISYTAPSGSNCDFHSGISLYCNGNQIDGVGITLNRCPIDGSITGYVDDTRTERSSNIINFNEQKSVYLTTAVNGGTSSVCGNISDNVGLWKEGDGTLSGYQLTFTECYQRATLRLSCCEQKGTGSTRGYHLRKWDETSSPGPPSSIENCGDGYERVDLAVSVYSTTCYVCPDSSVDILYTTLTMGVSESQTLTTSVPYIDPVTGQMYNYTWSVSGGGTLIVHDPGNVTYYSPSSNANCDHSPRITLSCGGTELDHIDIAISKWNEIDVAYTSQTRERDDDVCGRDPSGVRYCNIHFTYEWYNCYDERVFYYAAYPECDEWELNPWPGCDSCWACAEKKGPCDTAVETESCDGFNCPNICRSYCNSGCPPGDSRTPAMKLGGCCPRVFWCRDNLVRRKQEAGCYG